MLELETFSLRKRGIGGVILRPRGSRSAASSSSSSSPSKKAIFVYRRTEKEYFRIIIHRLVAEGGCEGDKMKQSVSVRNR